MLHPKRIIDNILLRYIPNNDSYNNMYYTIIIYSHNRGVPMSPAVNIIKIYNNKNTHIIMLILIGQNVILVVPPNTSIFVT